MKSGMHVPGNVLRRTLPNMGQGGQPVGHCTVNTPIPLTWEGKTPHVLWTLGSNPDQEPVFQERDHAMTQDQSDRTEMEGKPRDPKDFPPQTLTLKYRGKTLMMGDGKDMLRSVVIGRDKESQLIVPKEFVSRRHVTLEYLRGRFVLTDHSTNGTYVKVEEQDALHVHGGKAFVHGKGILSLGRDPVKKNADFIYFFVAQDK